MSKVATAATLNKRFTVRASKHRYALIILLICFILIFITSVLRPNTSSESFAVNNPDATGTQALATILRENGIDVQTINSVDALLDNLKTDAAATTVALINPDYLTYTEQQTLAHSGADITIIDAAGQNLDGFTPLIDTDAENYYLPQTAQCTDPDAQAAQALSPIQAGLRISNTQKITACFPVDINTYAYAVTTLAGGGTARVLADGAIATNAQLDKAGNAALAIRALGHQKRLLWFDAANQHSASLLWDSVGMPPWFAVVVLQAVVVLAVLAVVKGKRFGALVPEDLPVLVQASETTRGRGQLYYAAADRFHAAQTLRAYTAARIGKKLGVPPTASRAAFVQAICQASGLTESFVAKTLYGAIASTDSALVELANQLEHLESEI